MDELTLENVLEEKCKNHVWLAWILFLTAGPIIFNSVNLASYTFLGGDPPFFCHISELEEANWTKEQIREISSPGLGKQSCFHYAWNYTLLKDLSFGEALQHVNVTKKPELIKCKNHMYDYGTVYKTIISEWDLVCDNSHLASAVQISVVMGKLWGAIIFGLLSDRFGRKKVFICSCILYGIAGPAAAFVNSSTLFIIFRVLIGIACAGVLDAGYTLLLEVTVKHYRTYLGNLYNIGFSLGLIYLPVAAYYTNSWRQLQLAISVPMVLFVILCWFLPESPRWLITVGKFDKASEIIGKEYKLDKKDTNHHPSVCLEIKSKSSWRNALLALKNYFNLFSTPELSKRILISYYTWFTGMIYYYATALNGSNIDVNEYIYIGLSGIIELPSCFLAILLLTYFGRKSIGVVLNIVAGSALLVSIAIPKGWPIMCITLFGRLVGSAAYNVSTLHSSEIFPTEHRNAAIGSCITMSQFGPLLAPYLIDVLGKKAWWMPTTVCGLLAVVSGLLLLLLPETRDTPMPDTIKGMNLD